MDKHTCHNCGIRHTRWVEVDPIAPAPIVAKGISSKVTFLRQAERARKKPNVLFTENQFQRTLAKDATEVVGESTKEVVDKLKKLMETWNTHTGTASSADVRLTTQLANELGFDEIEVSVIGRRSAQEHESQPVCYQRQFAKVPKLLGNVADYFGYLDLSVFKVALYAYCGSANWDKIEIQEHRLEMVRQVDEIIQEILRGPSRLVIFTSPDRFSRCPEWAIYLWDTFERNGLMIMVLNGDTLLKECKEIVTSVMIYDLQRNQDTDSDQASWLTPTGQSD